MTNTLVTIIIPVYNVAKYLRYTINSILDQTYRNWELLLIDDGSTDLSGNICDSYSYDKRIRIIHKINEGVSVARNIGINQAKGKYIIFCDSDDIVYPTYIESLLWSITRYNADIAYCDTIQIDETETAAKCVEYNQHDIVYTDNEIVNLPDEFYYTVWGKIYKTELISNNSIFFDKDLNRGEDMLFMYCVTLCCNKVVHHCAGLVNYRIRYGSLMRSPTNTPLQSQNILKFHRLVEFIQPNKHNINLIDTLKKDAAIPILQNILQCSDYINFQRNTDLICTDPVLMKFLLNGSNKFYKKHKIIIDIIYLYRFKFIRYLLYIIILFLNK